MKLTFLKGKSAGESHNFNPPGVFIGREKDNDLQLLEEGVSQYHAKILFDNDKWSLYDLNSSNGTKVNDKKIDKAVTLNAKDVIYIGNDALRFETEKEEPPPGKDASPVKVADDDDDECIKIRGPEEAKPKPKTAETEKDPEVDDKIKKQPKKSQNQIAEARKIRRLLNEALKEKQKRLKIIIFIIAVIVNAILLIVWLRSESYI